MPTSVDQSAHRPIANVSDPGKTQMLDGLATSARVVVKVLDVLGVAIAGSLVVLLMLLSVFDVGMRQVGSQGVTGTIEWTEVVLVIMVFAGMAPAESSGAHIRTPLVTNRLPDKWAHGVRAAAQVMAAAYVAWLANQAFLEAKVAIDINELKIGVVEVPVWPAKLGIGIGLVALCVVMLCRILLHLHDLWRGVPARDEEFESLP